MRASEISLVGVGNGGLRILSAVAELTDDQPALIALNTDARSLEEARATAKIQIGRGHTEGLGAGGHLSLGRLAAEDDIDLVRAVFESARLSIVVAGLGGGTGTGATPIVLGAARDAGTMTLCFATLPFVFEGTQRREQAEEAIDELREAADALIVIPNDRLFQSTDETQVADAFAEANRILATGLCAVWKLLTTPGYIHLDFADIKRIVQQTGRTCSFGYGEGHGNDRQHQAVNRLLQGSLLAHGQLVATAASLLVSIVGGSDLTLKEVGDIMNAIAARVSKDCVVKMGTVIDDRWCDRVTVTVIASETVAAAPHDETAEGGEGLALQPEQEPTPKRKRGRRDAQTSLSFGATGKGRFKDVEPTMMDGEDLDIPTYVRRNIRLPK